MTIYLDNDFKCHLINDGTMMPYETDYFDGKCPEYIESYRFLPDGYTWTREDGEVFGPDGDMMTPWKDMTLAEIAQLKYKNEQLQNIIDEFEAALSEIEIALGV